MYISFYLFLTNTSFSSLIFFHFSSVSYRHVSTEVRLNTHFADHIICRNKWNNFVILYLSLQKYLPLLVLHSILLLPLKNNMKKKYKMQVEPNYLESKINLFVLCFQQSQMLIFKDSLIAIVQKTKLHIMMKNLYQAE